MIVEVKDPEKFEMLKKKIGEVLGFDCSQYSNSFLTRRIETRLRAVNIDSYSEYSRLLSESADEQKRLDKELTIHVTNFFRDQSMWNFFMSDIIPELIRRKKARNEKNIRIWSAGSSTGEEAYSIAICLKEVLGDDLGGFNVSITGTDYDQKTVDKAKIAKYETLQFREMPPAYLKKYFQSEESTYSPVLSLKTLVRFERGDILSNSKPKNIDIIFCRNTVIYFDSETKNNLYLDFHNVLNKDGFLIIGKTETIMGSARTLYKAYNTTERIFEIAE
ncbi:MAG: CheR family methyltransferase [Candidatus Woesearchaeota archaeon]